MKHVAFWVFASLLVMAGFQNCSKVAVGDLDPAASSKVVGVGDNIDPGMDDGNMPTDPSTDPGVNMPDAPGSPDPGSGPIVHNDDPGMPTNPPAPPKEDAPPSNPGSPSTPPVPPTNPPVVDDGPTTPPGPLDDIDQGDATALCLAEDGSHLKNIGTVSLISGSDISDVRGPVLVESDKLHTVENIRGHLVIKGKTSQSTTELIKNVRGSVVICGMIVEKIDDVRGSLLLVNSTVKSLSNHRGAVRMMNSELGSTQDIRGQIKEVSQKKMPKK